MENSIESRGARAKLLASGFDFDLVDKIALKLSMVISEYGDCPEVALASIAHGYNAKCLAEMSSEPAVLYSFSDKIEFALTAEEIDNWNKKERVQFEIIKDFTALHEDLAHEVIWE